MKRALKTAFAAVVVGAASTTAYNYQIIGSSVLRLRGPQESVGSPADVLTSSVKENINSNEMTLKQVQVYFRHGARTPLRHMFGLEEVVYDKRFILAPVPFTEIPLVVQGKDGSARPASSIQAQYAKVQFKGGVSAGMLTAVGREQAYLLGVHLASQYSKLLGKEFDPKQIHVTSTNIDRCIQSLGCVIAGIYGSNTFHEHDPVLVRVFPLAQEIMIPRPHQCPTLEALSRTSFDIYTSDPGVIELYNKIIAITGDTTPLCEYDMMQLRDHVVAREAHGLLVPEFLLKLYAEIDRAAVVALMAAVCVNLSPNDTYHNEPLGLSLVIGGGLNMIKETLTRAADPVKGEGEPKVTLYCCHDSSIAPILAAMGCFDNEWPPYMANIIIELYEDAKKRHWIKVKYCDKEMKLRGTCDTLITLDEFLAILKPYSLTEDEHKVHCNSMKSAVKKFGGHGKEKAAEAMCELPPNIR